MAATLVIPETESNTLTWGKIVKLPRRCIVERVEYGAYYVQLEIYVNGAWEPVGRKHTVHKDKLEFFVGEMLAPA